MACCQYNFNSSILASGKTRMAPRPSKIATAWRLASNSKTMPVAMKCQINNQLKPDLPQHKPGSPWENWLLPTTSQLHRFCNAQSLFSQDLQKHTLFCAFKFVLVIMKSVRLTIFCSSRIVANKGACRHFWNVRSFAQMCACLRKCALVVRPGFA